MGPGVRVDPAAVAQQSERPRGEIFTESEIFMNRKEKSEEIAELQGKLAKATTAVVTEYKGLTVAE